MIHYEFFDTDVREENIHPDKIFSKERELAHKYLSQFHAKGHVEPCLVCHSPRGETIFTKWGFEYLVCPQCWTISLASMPAADIIHGYHYDSALSQFRASKGYQDTVSQKRSPLWNSLIEWLEGRVFRYAGSDKCTVIDWGSKYTGWIDSLANSSLAESFHVQEPLPPILQEDESVTQAGVICLIDVLQRVISPHDLLARVAASLEPGGLLVLSCRSGTGFDILTLRGHSESIFPLDHVFLPSLKGIQQLLEQNGFDVLELTTPGLMDMTYISKNRHQLPRDQYFLRYMLDQVDEQLMERMQGFLQRNNLSSHVRCVAQKR